MRNTLLTTRHFVVIFSALLVLILSACGPSEPEATPTMSVDEIYTAAFQTLSAQQATQLALTPPTSTPSLTPSPTLAPPPTLSTTLPLGTTVGGAAAGCDSSVYVNDVTIPDGTIMDPGETFVKTWTIMNNGTCAWSTSYKLSFISGEAMGGTSVPVPSAVPAGQQAQISVNLTAPANNGNYTGWWRLQNASGQYFGNSISVVIKVGGGAAAATNTSGTPATAAATTGTP